METQKQTQERLKGIFDRIGPSMWLTVDDRFLAAAFGNGYIPNDVKAIAKDAEKFANDNECAFRYEPGKPYGDGVGFFGRAYFKKINDVP